MNSNVEAADLALAWDAAQALRSRASDEATTSPLAQSPASSGRPSQDPDHDPSQPFSARVWLQQQLPGHALRATVSRSAV